VDQLSDDGALGSSADLDGPSFQPDHTAAAAGYHAVLDQDG